MRSAGQIPLSRALDNARKEAAVRYSGTAANGATEMISPLIFHPAFPLLSPSNLRPFGAPPSIGRREYPRKPLPLEGAAERSEAGLASFLGGEAASSLTFPLGKSLCREKRYPPIATFPTRGRLCRGYCFSTHACIRSDDMGIALLSQTTHLRRSPLDLFHTAIPIQPPPLRGTSFHRKEGVVHASPFPWKGLPSAARRGWLSFLRRSRLLFAFPIGQCY